jgi:Glycosyl transferase family 2
MSTSFKAAFVITTRDKAQWVAQAVRGALAQTYPCHIILSDQHSEDGSYEAMESALEGAPRGAEHKVELKRCPIEGKYGMRAANAHTLWLMDQTDAEWVFQCSADDYSLPERVMVCMAAAEKNPCAAVACTMFFANPGEQIGQNTPMSGYPLGTGYVPAGEGLAKLAYGSTIQGWNREWFLKAGSAGDATGDVFHGFLAALNLGYYVVANPQHVHVQHASLDNMGFQGKMRAAAERGDPAEITRINELNRFQLCDLYYTLALRAQQMYPMAHTNDMNALVNMILSQTGGWLNDRKKLHEMGLAPEIL